MGRDDYFREPRKPWSDYGVSDTFDCVCCTLRRDDDTVYVYGPIPNPDNPARPNYDWVCQQCVKSGAYVPQYPLARKGYNADK